MVASRRVLRAVLVLGALVATTATVAWLVWPARTGDAAPVASRPAPATEVAAPPPATVAPVGETTISETLVRETVAPPAPESRPGASSARLAGRVVEKGAGPIAGAAVRVSWVVTPKEEAREAHCAADGRFAVEALPARKVVVVARADGFVRGWTEVETREGECIDVELELTRGWTVLGTVRDAARSPVPRASIQAEGRALGTRSGAMSAADGAFRVDGSSAPPELLRVVLKGYFEQRVRLHWPDPAVRVQTCLVVLTVLPAWCGRLLDERGTGLAGWFVHAESKLPYQSFVQSKTDADGRFALRLDEGRRYRIGLVEREGIAGFFCDWVSEVEAGAPELTITVPDRVRPSAFVRGLLLDASGEPLAKAPFTVRLACGSRLRDTAPTDATGAFRIGPLPPQKVRLFVRRAGAAWPLLDLGEVDLAREQELELGTVRLGAPATIAVVAKETDGVPVAKATVQADHESGELMALVDLRDGRAELALSPGTYSVAVSGGYLPNRRERMSVASGELANLEFALTRGMRQELAIEIPGAESAGRRCTLVLHRPDGSTERSGFDPEISADLPARYVFFVARGEHRVDVVTDAGKRFEARFTIKDLEQAPEWLLVHAEPR